MSERFKSAFPLPAPYEKELLIILIEECAEVQQRATKLLRFGRDEVQPGQSLTNSERLSQEVGDLGTMISLVGSAGFLNWDVVNESASLKYEKLKKYMQEENAAPDK